MFYSLVIGLFSGLTEGDSFAPNTVSDVVGQALLDAAFYGSSADDVAAPPQAEQLRTFLGAA